MLRQAGRPVHLRSVVRRAPSAADSQLNGGMIGTIEENRRGAPPLQVRRFLYLEAQARPEHRSVNIVEHRRVCAIAKGIPVDGQAGVLVRQVPHVEEG